MSFFAEAETFVFWDMNECKIPNDLVIESLYKNIKSALANEGYHGNVSIRGYGRKNHIGDEFLPEGFTFIHERLKGNRRDFRIWEDSFLSVPHFIPCNVMLIVHDDALAHLENSKGINILVAQNVINQSLVQKLAAASVWLWKSLSRGGSPNCLNESACTMISSKTKISLPAPSPNKPIMISDSIPNELILEILLRLPAKSVARFHCVSKLWASIFDRPYFKELFLTRSLARPQLLFSLEENGVWSYFSLPQHQMSLVVAAEFHMKFPPENIHLKFPPYNSLPIYSHRSRQFSCGYASGLIYLYAMWIEEEKYSGVPVIFNPNTGRYATLPSLARYRQCYSFLGFDPIDKEYKVLFMAYPSGPDANKVLTYGNGKLRWRTIQCSIKHEIVSEGICINGVLYYLGDREDWVHDETSQNYMIVCFDVRYEKFKFIFVELLCDELINYKGKLGVIYYDDYTDDAIELRLWVLEDLEKEEWTKHAYTLRYDRFFRRNASVVGVTAAGEIVLSMGDYTSEEPFYVYYFNPERNTIQRVEIQGFGEYHKAFRNHVYTFVDHIEDLNCINDAKLLQSRIYVPCGGEGGEREDE
ncbi:F-box protein [Cardamine amara subsp. amara]|uniref:F-box protein n=1 Tax=Cardamine amara subsp. amara TaxID=228776 RepID=A0ABD1AHP4_CARAN